MQSSTEHDVTEVAKLVVGPPGLQAHVPVKSNALSRLKRLLTGAPLHEVGVWSAQATISSSDDDDGTIFLQLDVTNFGKRPVRARHLHLGYLYAGGYDLKISAPFFVPPESEVPPHDRQVLHFRAPFGAPGVRLLLRTIQPAQNVRSSPRLELKVGGTLEAQTGKTTIYVRFDIVITAPLLMMDGPSVRK